MVLKVGILNLNSGFSLKSLLEPYNLTILMRKMFGSEPCFEAFVGFFFFFWLLLVL